MITLFRKNRRDKRDLFTYWDGEKDRKSDPLLLWRTLWEHPGCSVESDVAATFGYNLEGSPVEFDRESEERVIQMVKDVFGVALFSDEVQTGLTILEMTDLLMSFMTYMSDLKKKRDILLTPRAHMGLESSETSTTEPASESSSTPTELKSGEFTRSSKQSAVQSAET